MRNLLIIGARGLGREIYDLFLQCKTNLGDVECKGFLDDNPNALDGFNGFPPIIDSVENYCPQDNDVFICALGEPKWIRHYVEIIKRKGGQFISLISPDAYVSPFAKCGEGCAIIRWAHISCNVSIGAHTYLGAFTAIGHDAEIGRFCHMGSYTFMGGWSSVGNGVTCHPRINILPHVKVGNNVVIGAGSVVMKPVKDNITVFGNPAKYLCDNK